MKKYKPFKELIDCHSFSFMEGEQEMENDEGCFNSKKRKRQNSDDLQGDYDTHLKELTAR